MKKTIQRVFQLGFKDYLKKHSIPLHYHKAAYAIMSCRTAVLGGHSQYCENNHLGGVWYNSCKHRSCPQCRGIGHYRWLAHQKERLLDCEHSHLIFTIPHEYLIYWRYNTEQLMRILFLAASESLTDLLHHDPRKTYLDAQPGFILGLHTWGRDLSLHPHLHCILTDGGLTASGQWVSPKRSIILPARVLMAVFRGKFNDFIRRAARQKQWKQPPGTRVQQVINLSQKMGRKKWNVYIKEHFKYSGHLLDYLVNYMRGGPLKNTQINQLSANQITFRYYPHKENPDGKKEKSAYKNLSLEDFIHRYLQHIPSPGKVTVRHYGVYSNGNRKKLNQARGLFQQLPVRAVTESKKLSWLDYLQQFAQIAGKTYCQQCQQPLRILKAIPGISIEQLLHYANAPP